MTWSFMHQFQNETKSKFHCEIFFAKIVSGIKVFESVKFYRIFSKRCGLISTGIREESLKTL